MENPDVSSLLEDLEPSTEFVKVQALWDKIKETRAKGVKLVAIHKALKEAGHIDMSYVSFTRAVKKCKADDANGITNPSPVQIERRSAPNSFPSSAKLDSQNLVAAPDDNIDRSQEVVTEAALALSEAQAKNRERDYSKNIRRKRE